MRFFYAFRVARVLPTTFCSYKKLRTSYTNNYKYTQNIDSTITFSDKKPYLAISCNCCCRQYFLWRILFNSNDLGSFFRQFGYLLKLFAIIKEAEAIYLNAEAINLNADGIFLNAEAIYLNAYNIFLNTYDIILNAEAIYLNDYDKNLNAETIYLITYDIILNDVAINLNRVGNYLNNYNKKLIEWAISLFVFSFFWAFLLLYLCFFEFYATNLIVLRTACSKNWLNILFNFARCFINSVFACI